MLCVLGSYLRNRVPCLPYTEQQMNQPKNRFCNFLACIVELMRPGHSWHIRQSIEWIVLCAEFKLYFHRLTFSKYATQILRMKERDLNFELNCLILLLEWVLYFVSLTSSHYALSYNIFLFQFSTLDFLGSACIHLQFQLS